MGRPKKVMEEHEIGEIPPPQSNGARLRIDSPAADIGERLSTAVLKNLLKVDELIIKGCFRRARNTAKALSLNGELKHVESLKIERMIVVAQDMLDRHNWQLNHAEDDVAEPEQQKEIAEDEADNE
jgi:hypothetical protein